MGIHDGHRQRVIERFFREGLDNFTEVQVLEFLLFFIHAQGDTNEIAHKLIDYFGSLSRVLEAPMNEMQKIKGVGPKSALLLHSITHVARYYMVNRALSTKILNTTEACGEYLVPYFHGRANETVFLLCLDAKCKVLDCREVSEGSVNSAGVSTRRVVEIALAAKASSVVLAHNHPSGIAVPSREDVQTTYRVEAAMDAVDITLADHIIVSDGDYTSMVQSGFFKRGAMAHR